MRLENMPRVDESDIEDLRLDTVVKNMKKKAAEGEGYAPKGDLETPDKTLVDDPTGDIGTEMQPAMRGYGKIEKNLQQWKVR